MAKNPDSNGELRAAFTLRELENAKRITQGQAGPVGVLIRVTLAIIFIYLVGTSYLMLGIAGPVFVSVLFLTAFFIPVIYQVVMDVLERRRKQKKDRMFGRGSAQES